MNRYGVPCSSACSTAASGSMSQFRLMLTAALRYGSPGEAGGLGSGIFWLTVQRLPPALAATTSITRCIRSPAAVLGSSAARNALLAAWPAPSAARRCCSSGFSAIAAV